MIDWSISVGNLLTMVGFMGGGIAFVVAVRRDVSYLSRRLMPIENAVETVRDHLSTLVTTMGRHDERLKAVERDVERNDPRKHFRQASPR